jgi:hypothetical protein
MTAEMVRKAWDAAAPADCATESKVVMSIWACGMSRDDRCRLRISEILNV